MPVMVFSQANMITMLASLKALWTTTPATPKVGLFNNNPTLNQFTQFTDLVEPTGTWYTQKAAVITDPYRIANDGSINLGLDSLVWPYTGTSPSDTINGWFCWDATSLLYGAAYFPVPIIMATTLDIIFTPVGNWHFLPATS
jgi:hypothetical protein